MRIVAATRILNEEDIVEAFIRHHAPQLDHHILLDNASNDRTVDILRALRDEAPNRLDLLQIRSATFSEQLHNTFLYQRASALGADWVCFLDADEFLDLTPARSLRDALAEIPPAQEAVTVPLVNYYTTGADNHAELLVCKRLTHRIRQPHGVDKLFIRGRLPGAQILNGNHAAILEGRLAHAAPLPGARLAHYHTRSPQHFLAKALIGRVKVLASGAEAQPELTSSHYNRFLDLMRDDPANLLANEDFIRGLNGGLDLVEDLISYQGTPLTHTIRGDDTLRAIRSLAHAAEGLARSHGRLLDENLAIRTQLRLWNVDIRPIA